MDQDCAALLLLDLGTDGGLDSTELALLTLALAEGEEKPVYKKSFDLDKYTDTQCKEFFRFPSADIRRLQTLLRMPDTMQAANGFHGHGTKASGLEVLCIVLRRLSYPCRYTDLTMWFDRPKDEICRLFNLGVDHIYTNFGGLLTDFNQPWLTIQSLQQFAQAIRAKGAPLPNCWGFIDGTVRQMCRPGQHQREVFNGHHRVHGLKFQSVVTPNGIVANLYGPMCGRRHDAALLHNSGIMDYMEQHMYDPTGAPLYLYGDPAYPLAPHLMRPYRGQHITQDQQDFNTDMSGVRQSVEWEFGKIVREFAFLDFEKNLKLFLTPVGKLYIVGVLLSNCHTCLYGSETSSFFGLNPPTLEEYLH